MRFKTTRAKKVCAALVLWAFVGVTPSARAQDATQIDVLEQLNGSIESLVERVSQSVVQVLVTSYGPVEQGNHTDTDLVIGRQRSMASGVIVDAAGYIVTNAHVIANARRIQVVLPAASERADAIRSLIRGRGRTVDATIVGVAREIDLALIKVDEDSPLQAIPMADYDALRQGELTFAFGSPEGLRNSVTMGIVSAVARQPDPDAPMVYIQTDAPINHGNSGGPLVNIKGELVGINTFILSESGGSQGLGFAIPSALIRIAYPKLRRYGQLHRGQIGASLQTITPTLAAGLGLLQDSGVMISDVTPGSPADEAGLRPEDVVLAIDGKPIDGLPRLTFELFTRTAGERLSLQVRRGSEMITADMIVAERTHDIDRLPDLIDPDKSVVAALGILGVDVDGADAQLAWGLRMRSGVMVAGHTTGEAEMVDAGLITGDTIHALNGKPVTSVTELRALLNTFKSGSPVVLRIERNTRVMFLSFELD